MKTVFSNRQLCHVWAQQEQSHGRGSNLFFEEDKIWSYGRHYLAAQIHTVKVSYKDWEGKKRNDGKARFALVNSHNYSNSTAKHLSCIRGGLQGIMPYFSCSDVSDPKKALSELDSFADTTIENALNKSKVTDKESIQYQLEWITRAFDQANDLRKLLGKATRHPKRQDLLKVTKHLESRLARYHELNTPEMQAKKAAEKAKREERANAKRIALLQEKIAEFREGKPVGALPLPYELLRVRGDVVETSRGAQVPLNEALRLYQNLKSGQGFSETRVGHFRFGSIDRTLVDPIVEIGCHRIKLSEADLVLGKLVQV